MFEVLIMIGAAWIIFSIPAMGIADTRSHETRGECPSPREFVGVFILTPIFILSLLRYVVRIPMFFVGAVKDGFKLVKLQ